MNISKSFLGKLFLFFIAATFILFGISSFFFSMTGYNVVNVSGEKVSINAFIQILNQQRQEAISKDDGKDQLDYILSESYKMKVLRSLIRDILINKEVERIGIKQSANSVFNQLSNNPYFADSEGKFDINKYNDMIHSSEHSESEYIDSISKNNSKLLILSVYSRAIPIVNSVIKDLVKYNNIIKTIDLYTVDLDKLKLKVDEPKEEDLLAFYENNKNSFIINSKMDISYVDVDLNKEKVDVSEKEIESDYIANKNKYKKPTLYNIYYFASEKIDVANEVYESLSKGTDPSKVGNEEKDKTYLEDIDTNEISDDDMRETIESLKEKQFSQVKQFGNYYIVIYVDKIIPEKQLTLKEVKNEIKEKLIVEKMMKKSERKVSELQDAILVSENLEQLAKTFNLKVVKINNVNKDNVEAKVPNFKEILTYQEGDFSDLQTENSDVYRIYYVNKYVPERIKTFEEAKNEIVEIITEPLIRTKLDEELSKLNKDNISSFARRNNIDVSRNVKINISNEKYSNSFIKSVIASKDGDLTKSYKNNSNYIFALIKNEEIMSETNSNYIDEKSVEYELWKSYNVSLINHFLTKLERQYKLKINQKILNMVE